LSRDDDDDRSVSGPPIREKLPGDISDEALPR
jgi:hypothetical protein